MKQPNLDHASDLRGFPIVSLEEGAILGTLTAVYVDVQDKRLVGIGWRTQRFGGDRLFAPIACVRLVGRDAVIIRSEEDATNAAYDLPPGTSLADLQGLRVTTAAGKHLGTLVDLDMDADWNLKALILAEDQRLPVDRTEVRIADEIIVPAEYTERVESLQDDAPGMLERAFGKETLDRTRNMIKRILPSSKDAEHEDATKPE